MDLSKYQKMLLGVAMGDAWGAGYEFRYKDLKDYQDIALEKYIKSNFTDSDHFPGMYTDDTQMSIGVAEMLLSDKEFTRENLADMFVECYKRDPIIGYAKHFQKFIDSINSGKEFIEQIKPDSIRNGACMRSIPLGVVKDIATLVEYAKINASLTHNTSKGIASSVAIGLLSHVAVYEGFDYTHKKTIRDKVIPEIKKIDEETASYLEDVLNMQVYVDFISSNGSYVYNPVLLFGEKHATKGVPCDGMRTVGAVVYLLTNIFDPKKILEESIKLGGDTDSVASISLGISLMNEQSLYSLPSFLYDELTTRKYGREYILELGKKLSEKFPYN